MSAPVDTVYWLSPLGHKDDFGQPYEGVMYDARTRIGTAWANMTEDSWKVFGVGKLGLGLGQKYEKQPDGSWLKVEG